MNSLDGLNALVSNMKLELYCLICVWPYPIKGNQIGIKEDDGKDKGMIKTLSSLG